MLRSQSNPCSATKSAGCVCGPLVSSYLTHDLLGYVLFLGIRYLLNSLFPYLTSMVGIHQSIACYLWWNIFIPLIIFRSLNVSGVLALSCLLEATSTHQARHHTPSLNLRQSYCNQEGMENETKWRLAPCMTYDGHIRNHV